MRITAAVLLAVVLLPLAAWLAFPLFGAPRSLACQYYTAPVTFTAIREKAHPRGGNYVGRPDVEFFYVLDGRRYVSGKLSCTGNADFGYEHGRMRSFLREAERGMEIVAWIPAGDPAGGCISLTRSFGYSKVHEVAKLCRR